MCAVCGGTPCDWETFKDDVIKAMNDYKNMYVCKNSRIRKEGYKTFTLEKYGYLGRSNRIKIADCVTNEIRKLYPEESEDAYMNFQSK